MAGLYCSLLPYICVREFQYFFGNWQDFSSHLSGPWTSKNMSCFGLWVCSSSWPLQLAKHSGHRHCYAWNDTLFILLHHWEPAEVHRGCIPSLSGIITPLFFSILHYVMSFQNIDRQKGTPIFHTMGQWFARLPVMEIGGRQAQYYLLSFHLITLLLNLQYAYKWIS